MDEKSCSNSIVVKEEDNLFYMLDGKKYRIFEISGDEFYCYDENGKEFAVSLH